MKTWGRGPFLLVALAAFIALGCSRTENVTGPRTEQDPFQLFDAVSPPVQGVGAVIPNGRISGGIQNVLTKPTGQVRTKTKKIKARKGGSISVLNYPTYARLTVLEGSISEDVKIEMTLLGSLGSIALEFGPDGQTFSPAAVLDIVRPIENLDPESLKLFLTTADGSVEPLRVEVMQFGDWMRVRTWISHFSGVGDEEDDGRTGDEPNPES